MSNKGLTFLIIILLLLCGATFGAFYLKIHPEIALSQKIFGAKVAEVVDENVALKDAPINENDEFNLLEIIEDNSFPADKNLAYDESLKRDILTCLKNLTPIQSEVIKKSFGIDYEKPYSLEEIGYEMNLSRERVRQIKHKGLTRLRASHPKKILQEYLI